MNYPYLEKMISEVDQREQNSPDIKKSVITG